MQSSSVLLDGVYGLLKVTAKRLHDILFLLHIQTLMVATFLKRPASLSFNDSPVHFIIHVTTNLVSTGTKNVNQCLLIRSSTLKIIKRTKVKTLTLIVLCIQRDKISIHV